MIKYHIIGGNGFVGQKICDVLQHKNLTYEIISRDDSIHDIKDFDRIIYCAGNGDCINNPFDVFEANSNLLVKILKHASFNKLVYLSSTRLYMNSSSSEEISNLVIGNNDNRRLFNLTKLLSEEMCLRSGKNVTIMRPSNIYGTALKSSLFLPSIIRDAILKGTVNMYVDENYSKDYISVNNVAEASVFFSNPEAHNNEIINIASGRNVSAKEIARILIAETGCNVVWHSKKYVDEVFPITNASLLKKYIPEMKIDNVTDDLKDMISQFNTILGKAVL